MAFRTIALAFLAVFLGQSALACDVGRPAGFEDAPITVFADGSFEAAESLRGPLSVSGSAPVALGNERTEQLITQVVACTVYEELLLAECDTGALLILHGDFSREIREALREHFDTASSRDLFLFSDNEVLSGIEWRSQAVANIRPPEGPIDTSADLTFGQLSDLAEGSSIGFDPEVWARLAEMDPQNRYDPYIGCRIHYPDSAGAQL